MSTTTDNASSSATFAERDFVDLAGAIDQVPAPQRELFLTKLVILLAAGAPAGLLADRIQRAGRHLSG
ncbi:MAG: hypothetical protein ACT6UH_05810 [Hydrogenophaga sp.]|jgi:hypothetical protein|uniref:hypothetical protein n=1 Tax=unclassified Hydrogenophaga TaxID=2610897 RepID=UPI0036D21C31